VRLEKVYRSTRPILEYIRSQGFTIDIPDGIREGEAVQEYAVSKSEVQTTVRRIVNEKDDVLIGVIALRQEDLEQFEDLTSERCKVMTAVEAQGLEFDVVIYIRDGVTVGEEYTEALKEEKQRITRDQLYVALTRAMNELHVIVQK
jgi:DNA helicase IV